MNKKLWIKVSQCDIIFCMNKIQTLRKQTGLSQSKFASYFGIPTHTLQVWEQEVRTPPDYVISMMERILLLEGFCPVEKSVRR